MPKHVVAFSLAAAVVLLTLTGVGFGEDEPVKPMSEMEMFQKGMELARPGPMHEKVLSRLEGSWKAAGKMFSETMGEIPVTGASTNTWILGKRFIETKYEGPFMTGTFEGRSFLGYDNLTETFQQVWIMTMGSGMDVMKGSWDEAKQTLTWTYEVRTPDHRVWKKRDVWVFQSADAYMVTSFAAPPGGEEFKEMELRYTRVKADATK